jgi:hypothetical protein
MVQNECLLQYYPTAAHCAMTNRRQLCDIFARNKKSAAHLPIHSSLICFWGLGNALILDKKGLIQNADDIIEDDFILVETPEVGDRLVGRDPETGRAKHMAIIDERASRPGCHFCPIFACRWQNAKRLCEKASEAELC